MPRSRREVAVAQLSQMQRYLGEEMYEDYQEGLMTRREMLRRVLGICGGAAAAAALLAACGDARGAATPLPAPTNGATAPTTAPTANSTPATSSAPTSQPAATSQPAPNGSAPLAVAADDPAVRAEEVRIPGDAPLSGYLARPSAAGSYPGVVVIHENRGLTDHIRDVARRVAKAGYIAIAPDLASRAGGTAKLGSQIQAFFANAKPDELVADLNAAVAFLDQQPDIMSGKHGVVGFCFGGAYTLRLAAANPTIAAAVCYYGVTPDPASQMAATNAAILGQYGGNDQRVNSTIPALEQAMESAGKTYEKRVYDGANHAFNNDTGPNYNQDAAAAAWKDTLAWFEKYLKA